MTENSRDDSKKTPEAPQSSNESRRSFLTKAGKIAPLAIVATSLPAWGDKVGTPFRCGISGLVSGNVSTEPNQTQCQGGFSPGYWGNKNGWPIWAATPGHNMPFCGVGGLFNHCSCPGESYDYTGATLGDVIGQNGSGNNTFSGSFGFHATAAYLNSIYVSNYVFSTTNVLYLANTVMGSGTVDLDGILYDCGDIKALFDSTY